MAQMLKEVGPTAGGEIASRVLNEVDQMRHYPDKYSESEEARLEALKAIHNRFFHYIPDRWTLDPEHKTPHRMLMDGTWEKHWKRALRDKKITPLRGEVEDMLYVISDYLDKRRKNIWRYVNVSGIKMGDVEEQFFGEMIVWLKDILDSQVDEMLEEKIGKMKSYLHEVLMSMDVFPKQHIHDKSASREIVSKLYDMLENTLEEVKKIQAQQFTLRKFEEISVVTKTMIQHFLKGFSHFSPALRELDALKVSDLKTAIKKSDTRFAQLFLLFVRHFYKDNFEMSSEGSLFGKEEVMLHLSAFIECMQDERRQLGLPKEMPVEMREAITEIFASAYQLSKVMQLIREASSTLSEQGTIRLFCNTEGRNYFEFLLEHFKSVKDAFISKMAWFNGKGMGYAQKKVAHSGENPSKESEIGQYDRFRENYMDVESDNAALESHLSNAARQIKSFAGKTPENAEGRRERLYAKIREEMRKTNQHALADMLEKMSLERKEKEKAEHALEEEKSAVLESIPLMPLSHLPSCLTSMAASPEMRPFGYMLPEALRQKKMEKEFFIREKIKQAWGRMMSYYNASFFSIYMHSSITNSFADALKNILKDSPKLPLALFHMLIRDYLESVMYANEKTKNTYIEEEFYLVASELYFILSDKKYADVVFPKEEVEALQHELVSVKLQNTKLEEEIILQREKMLEKERAMQMQALCVEKNKKTILHLKALVSEKTEEIAHLKWVNEEHLERIDALTLRRKEQAEKIELLEKEAAVQHEKLDTLVDEMHKKENSVRDLIKEQFAEYLKNFSSAAFLPQPN